MLFIEQDPQLASCPTPSKFWMIDKAEIWVAENSDDGGCWDPKDLDAWIDKLGELVLSNLRNRD